MVPDPFVGKHHYLYVKSATSAFMVVLPITIAAPAGIGLPPSAAVASTRKLLCLVRYVSAAAAVFSSLVNNVAK